MKASLTVAGQHWAFSAALDDILSKGRQKKAVILYPRVSTKTADDDYREGPRFMWSAIQDLVDTLSQDAGILTIVAAGNAGALSRKIDRYPALWADSKPAPVGPGQTPGELKPLLAVGAVTPTGRVARFSQGLTEFQLRWAPGKDIMCAGGGQWTPEPVTAQGTSFAALMV